MATTNRYLFERYTQLREIQIEIRMKISNSFRCGWQASIGHQHRAAGIVYLVAH